MTGRKYWSHRKERNATLTSEKSRDHIDAIKNYHTMRTFPRIHKQVQITRIHCQQGSDRARSSQIKPDQVKSGQIESNRARYSQVGSDRVRSMVFLKTGSENALLLTLFSVTFEFNTYWCSTGFLRAVKHVTIFSVFLSLKIILYVAKITWTTSQYWLFMRETITLICFSKTCHNVNRILKQTAVFIIRTQPH